MNAIPYFNDYKKTLTGATDSWSFDVTGSWLAGYSSAEEFSISLDGGPGLLFSAGQFISWGQVQNVRMRVTPKPGAVVYPNALILRVGAGDYKDARLSFLGNLTIAPGTVIRTAPSVGISSLEDVALVANTNTLIEGANPDLNGWDVWNDSATITVRLASSSANLSGTRGLIVPPKSSRFVAMNGDLYARAVGGAATISATASAAA